MAEYNNPHDPHRLRRGRLVRRDLDGRRGSRLAPVIVRRQPAPRSRVVPILTRLLFGLAALCAVLLVAGAASAYGAYNQLAQSLSGRLDNLKTHKSFQTTRIYDRNGTLLYEFADAGRRTRGPPEPVSTTQ